MRFQRVAHAIGAQVASQKHDGVLVQRDVTESGVGLLKHGVKHVLHRVGTLGVLVQHHNQWLALMDFEPSIRVVACGLGVVVDDRHCNVAQVHIGYVDIRMFVPQLTSDTLQQG